MIKIFLFLLFSAFESIGGKYYRCQILICNSNGKLIWFAAIILKFKNVREPRGELGRRHVLSLHFTHYHPHRLQNYVKMTSRKESRCKIFVGSSNSCLSNRGSLINGILSSRWSELYFFLQFKVYILPCSPKISISVAVAL